MHEAAVLPQAHPACRGLLVCLPSLSSPAVSWVCTWIGRSGKRSRSAPTWQAGSGGGGGRGSKGWLRQPQAPHVGRGELSVDRRLRARACIEQPGPADLRAAKHQQRPSWNGRQHSSTHQHGGCPRLQQGPLSPWQAQQSVQEQQQVTAAPTSMVAARGFSRPAMSLMARVWIPWSTIFSAGGDSSGGHKGKLLVRKNKQLLA